MQEGQIHRITTTTGYFEIGDRIEPECQTGAFKYSGRIEFIQPLKNPQGFVVEYHILTHRVTKTEKMQVKIKAIPIHRVHEVDFYVEEVMDAVAV